MSWIETIQRPPWRSALLVVAVLLIGIAFSLVDVSPSLDHVDVHVLSGPEQGNYYAVVGRLERTARRKGGVVANEATRGTVDNLQQLADTRDNCGAQFALAQDGVPPPAGGLELIGRLPRPEAMFILGRNASRFTRFSQLSGVRMGVGPTNSGTDHLARAVFEDEDFRSLGIVFGNHGLQQQIELLATGELDLGVFVLDDDAALIRAAIRDRGLELAMFEHLPTLAARHPFVSLGTIPAGRYDPIALLPANDHPVLRVDTLVVGNGCSSRSETVGFLTLLADEFPGFIERNKRTSAGMFLRSAAAKQFMDDDGAGFADRHVPWLVDIMPLGNWIYVAMTLSILFNLMTGWHRFRLWRVDARRDNAHQLVRDVVGAELTPTEIAILQPLPEHRAPAKLALIDSALEQLDALRTKCRAHQSSVLVPMGQEWIYRYEEEQMEALLSSLRVFRARIADDGDDDRNDG